VSRRYGRSCAFEAEQWNVTDEVVRRSGVPARRGELGVVFGAAGHNGLGGFIRAYVGQLPRSGHAKLQTFVQAGCLIGRAMDALDVGSVDSINVATLNEALAMARDRVSPPVAARLQGAVRSLGHFLHTQGMTHASLSGALQVSLPTPDLDRAGEAFAARSQKLLPTDRFLEALTDAYRLALEPADIIITRILLLLLSAPGRINEALALEEHPQVERDAGGIPALGLRWRGSKGAADGVKWITPDMAPAVRNACLDLHRVTAEGRAIKAWYDKEPGMLHLPAALAHLRGKTKLTVEECAELLGRRPVEKLAGTSFEHVEARLLARLPAAMRDAGGTQTHPLLLMPWGAFDADRRPSCPCMFEAVQYRHVADALSSRDGRPGSLFRRLGVDPGEAIGGTHSLRRWVMTEALRGGLPLKKLAEWSGHASAREVTTYDYRTAAEMRTIVRRVSAAGRSMARPSDRPPFRSHSGSHGPSKQA